MVEKCEDVQSTMVKYSNKAKGKPSKRKLLKTKYKVQRKVKQHKKLMRREAKKMQGKGFKHKRVSQSEFLPNSFPFKTQMLDEVRAAQPQSTLVPMLKLDPIEYGLVVLDNKALYTPRPKQILLKKCITNQDKVFASCNVILQVVDARNPILCIRKDLHARCQKRILVVAKTDTVRAHRLKNILAQVSQDGTEYVCTFTTDNKQKRSCLEKLLSMVKQISERSIMCVMGKANTGKHTLLHELCKLTGQLHDASTDLFAVQLGQGITMLDATLLLEDSTDYPLFHKPQPLHDSVQAEEEAVIKQLFFDGLLSRSEILMFYAIQDYTDLEDLLKKVGKMSRLFGKGGNVDQARVRLRLLTEWYTGKINHLLKV